MKKLITIVGTLTIICILSAGSLSLLKSLTGEIIETQEMKLVYTPAIRSIFPSLDNNPTKERKHLILKDGTKIRIFPIKIDNKLTGVVLEVLGNSYGGPLGTLVGFSMDTEKLVGVGFSISKDTPGRGARVFEPAFRAQFTDVPFSANFALGAGVVSGISGATITSLVVVESVRKAINIFIEYKSKIIEDFQSTSNFQK